MLLEIGLPGLVFLALCIWLVRRTLRAARTERDLEEQRLQGAFAEELAQARALAAGHVSQAKPPAQLAAVPTSAQTGSQEVLPGHADVVAQLAEPGASVLWIRSIPGHAVWCERRGGADVLCVVKIDAAGHPGERWTFGAG